MGSCIAQQLAADQNLVLIGKTSRGCFLQTAAPPTWTVFLSEEPSRGPLTINLPPGVITPIKAAAAPVIPLRQGILKFSPTVSLSLQDVPLWQPPSPTNTHFASICPQHHHNKIPFRRSSNAKPPAASLASCPICCRCWIYPTLPLLQTDPSLISCMH